MPFMSTERRAELAGRAGGPDDVGHLVRVVTLVHSHHVGGNVSSLGGCGDDHLLGSGLNVLACSGSIHEHSGSLHPKC
ncbi:hypothetical protein Mapa_010326 [Marchantia paleacea]|nr:hypothetical protein Mapa_010326 [Marchantia paleacea]